MIPRALADPAGAFFLDNNFDHAIQKYVSTEIRFSARGI
jgi:hypothetical protein